MVHTLEFCVGECEAVAAGGDAPQDDRTVGTQCRGRVEEGRMVLFELGEERKDKLLLFGEAGRRVARETRRRRHRHA